MDLTRRPPQTPVPQPGTPPPLPRFTALLPAGPPPTPTPEVMRDERRAAGARGGNDGGPRAPIAPAPNDLDTRPEPRLEPRPDFRLSPDEEGDARVASDSRSDGNERAREDVRLLGDLLGEVLRAQEGPALFELVEQVRALAKRGRSGSALDAEALRRLLAALPTPEAMPLARAFSHFLALTNIAEQHHRVRRRRQRRRASPIARPSTPTGQAFARFLEAGITPDQLHRTVAGLHIDLVLTAHPTQATRRTLLEKHRRIANILRFRDRPDLLPEERQQAIDDLRREVLAIWQTDELRRTRPTPVDEAGSGLVLFEQVLWDALPEYLRALDRSLRNGTGRGLPIDAAPFRFGSWMGGDRDGNPNVTPAVTEEVCLLARWQAADLYLREVRRLHDELSMAPASPELRARVGGAPEPYRALLKEVIARLTATRRLCETQLQTLRGRPAVPTTLRSSHRTDVIDDAAPYFDPQELWSPLVLCYQSLHSTGAASIADGRLLDVLRRLAALGLSLIRLDLRQEAGVHARAMDAITQALNLGSYLAWTEEERVDFLVRELESPRPLLPRRLPDDPALTEVLGSLQVCARQPAGALGAYIISMASAPSDVLAVHLFQREAGITQPLRVVPLFETLADLDRAGAVVAKLLDVPWYRATAAGHQEVMIGYSDSTKDAGRMAAAWGLFRAQEDVVAACRSRKVRLTLFHGRGGTIGRGGGPIHLAILSQPPGSVDGGLRVTVQGEMVEASFGLHDVAVESFELYANATLEATLCPPKGPSDDHRALMDRLAALSAGAYRRVVQGNPTFLRYFQAATPEQELGRLNIGSRPARRRSGGADLGSLRAIPWIFAWTQTRLNLPAWLGVGEALTTLFEEGRIAEVQALAREWPFFRSLLDLFEMVLAKADPDIASYYDRVLVPDDLRPLGQELRGSCRNTIAAVLRAKQEDSLLDADPALRRTHELRTPYV
ncbi:MAG TPA: phosphoenolpyruvate carboxylase, partial [Polyangia bacterium]